MGKQFGKYTVFIQDTIVNHIRYEGEDILEHYIRIEKDGQIIMSGHAARYIDREDGGFNSAVAYLHPHDYDTSVKYGHLSVHMRGGSWEEFPREVLERYMQYRTQTAGVEV